MRTTDVLEQLRRLPMRPTAVTQVLAVLDDPDASAQAIASSLQSDPSLTARILHLANSPYFGLSGKVASVERAVVALGASVLRSLAVSTAAGMFTQRPDEMPPGFWRHSVSVAAGSSVAARMTAVPAGDAMCVGLLHDLGAALLYRFDGEDDGDHAAIGAYAMDVWKLPATIVDALRHHHDDPLDVADKLGRVVIAGEALARAAFEDPSFAHEPAVDPGAAFAALGVTAVSLDGLVARTAEETETLEGLFAPH